MSACKEVLIFWRRELGAAKLHLGVLQASEGRGGSVGTKHRAGAGKKKIKCIYFRLQYGAFFFFFYLAILGPASLASPPLSTGGGGGDGTGGGGGEGTLWSKLCARLL